MLNFWQRYTCRQELGWGGGGGGDVRCESLGSQERSKDSIIDLRGFVVVLLFLYVCLFFGFFLSSQILLANHLPVCKNVLLKGSKGNLSIGWGWK